MSKPVARALLPMMLALVCSAVHAQEQPAPAAPITRGQALYDTHCFACHTAQMHWRDKKQATDWVSLKGLVRRWQAAVGQYWSEDDIVAVARYLNEAYYRYPQQTDVVGSLTLPAR